MPLIGNITPCICLHWSREQGWVLAGRAALSHPVLFTCLWAILGVPPRLQDDIMLHFYLKYKVGNMQLSVVELDTETKGMQTMSDWEWGPLQGFGGGRPQRTACGVSAPVVHHPRSTLRMDLSSGWKGGRKQANWAMDSLTQIREGVWEKNSRLHKQRHVIQT